MSPRPSTAEAARAAALVMVAPRRAHEAMARFLRTGLMLGLFFFVTVLGGTRAAADPASEPAPQSPDPGVTQAILPALEPLTIGVPRDCWLLADGGLSAEESRWLSTGAGVAAVIGSLAVMFKMLRGDKDAEKSALSKTITDAILAQLGERSAKNELQIGGQPIEGIEVHPCVPQPTFDKHTDEIWKVVNGLRMAVSRIETVCGENKVLREANSDRLIEVASKLDATSDAVNRLIGGLEAYNVIPKQDRKHGK